MQHQAEKLLASNLEIHIKMRNGAVLAELSTIMHLCE